MGPNEGKTLLEQTKCVARALTAYIPRHFDCAYVFSEKHLKYELENKVSLIGKWLKNVSPIGDRYEFYPNEWSGKSRGDLPEGEKVAATFYCSENEANRTLEVFRRVVASLEKNVVVTEAFRNLAYGSNIVSEEREGNFDRQSVENLKRTVRAIHPGFNKSKIIEFRKSLLADQDVKQIKLAEYPGDVNHYLAVMPKHLKDFSKHLADERTKYCVDGYLFGSVATTCDICGYIAPKAASDNPILGASHNRAIFANFSLLAIYLTSSEIVDPSIVLAATIKRAITSGYSRELVEIVEKYQDIIYQKMSRALNARNTDDALNLLYDAIPYAFGARTICLNLRSNAEKIDSKTLETANAKYSQLDENLVRFIQPFSHQVTDFYGHQWRRKKLVISQHKKGEEEDKIKKTINCWIEELLLYPRSVINSLLSED
ncbi:MAG: hypothetical protein OEW62_04035 [Candidatus Bathyarchaeota archaeon]|nr:hypothetical protein [Candidatus Bathyarchaeota archaeon]MDH5745487.1 hypothetical protein [Candidatus Bathyarchaeota archaeon]